MDAAIFWLNDFLFGTPKRTIVTLSTVVVICFAISFEIHFPGVLHANIAWIGLLLSAIPIVFILLFLLGFSLALWMAFRQG